MTFFKLDLYNSVVHSDNWDQVFPCPNGKVTRPRRSDGPSFLPCRGYKKAFVLKQIRRARLKTREETLALRPRNATNRVPMVVTYHPSLPNIGSILRELQPLLHCSEKCRKAIKDVPFMAFRRPKSLGDYLVRAKLRPSTCLERSFKETVVCGNRRCQARVARSMVSANQR